ncbi:hypothetical protein CERSUDRAFT_113325 [Gelatoporia subvermispora B]|uniref:BTB domain-containing protein n=1 Tax=Ceriporiopsis subvermispora (strain B) TaxID=914234 RepID=M2RI60_CERS8|nr:hypothetical protein CERSUDRAFT_113325 [Gelatoporia subvermispora B]
MCRSSRRSAPRGAASCPTRGSTHTANDKRSRAVVRLHVVPLPSLQLKSFGTEGSDRNVSGTRWAPGTPVLASADADIVLSSSNNIHFHVHSQLLRHASGWFKTLLSLPGPSTPQTEPDVIRMDEPTLTLEALLCIASGMEVPALRPIDFYEDVLLAAEKYEMPGPISIVRIALSSNLLDAPPLRVYAIATRRGWNDEATAASARTLEMDLFDPELEAELTRIDASFLMKLLQLHHSRRQLLQKALDSTEVYKSTRIYKDSAKESLYVCPVCGVTAIRTDWLRLRYDLPSRPVIPSVSTLYRDPTMKEMSKATCSDCRKNVYDIISIVEQIVEILECLPKCVSLS